MIFYGIVEKPESITVVDSFTGDNIVDYTFFGKEFLRHFAIKAALEDATERSNGKIEDCKHVSVNPSNIEGVVDCNHCGISLSNFGIVSDELYAFLVSD